jgi:hypothetical protein
MVVKATYVVYVELDVPFLRVAVGYESVADV